MENKSEVPGGWTLTCAEVSNGVYEMRLTWDRGPVVETTGTDVPALQTWCIEAALAIEDQVRRKELLA